MKSLKRTSKKTEPKPEDFKIKEEAEAAMEEYLKNKPVYTILNIFIGGENKVEKVESDVKGVLPKY